MASFKAKFPVLQELFAKNHRGGGPYGPPAGRGLMWQVYIHFSVNTLFKYKTTFKVTDPPARASHHVMAMGGTVPYFIDLGNREMKSD